MLHRLMLRPETLDAVEEGARWLLGDAGKHVSMRALIREHLGTEPVVSRADGDDGSLVPIDGKWVVAVRRGLSAEKARWVAGHELSHWYWEHVIGYRGSDLEARCDALGAALVAPAIHVENAIDRHGDDVYAIARELRTTQSCALLRLGEVLGEPVALLRRRRSTIIRGDYVTWPVPLSWQPAKRAPGLVKVDITDEPGKFGVRGGGESG